MLQYNQMGTLCSDAFLESLLFKRSDGCGKKDFHLLVDLIVRFQEGASIYTSEGMSDKVERSFLTEEKAVL